MCVLHMDTDAVRQLVQSLRSIGALIYDQVNQITTSANQMGWIGPSRDQFQSQLINLILQIETLLEMWEQLDNRLEREVTEWEDMARIFSDGWFHTKEAIIAGIAIAGTAGAAATEGTGDGSGWLESSYVDYSKGREFDNSPNKFELIRVRRYDAYLGYRRGEMSHDEFLEYIAEDPFKENLVKGSVVLYGTAQAATFAAAHAKLPADLGSANFLSREYSAVQKVDISNGHLNAQANWDSAVYLGHVQADAELAGVTVAADAYVGANIEGGVNAQYNPASGDLMVGGGADAFVGGKAEASASKDFTVGEIDMNVGASGAISYGLGAKLEGNAGLDDGMLAVDFNIGATVGLGVEFGVNFELDMQDAISEIVDGAVLLTDF